jgi:hypothetical protein
MQFWGWVMEHMVPTKGNEYRPHFLRRSWLVFFLAVVLATEGFLVANLVARQGSQHFLAAVVPGEIIALTNKERLQADIGTLSESALLDAAAQAKANDMATHQYFAHVGPDGKLPWQWISDTGYQYHYAGENLAVHFVNAADVVDAWMQSPTHRANMVRSFYTQIGVGVADGLFRGQQATYVVEYFATPFDVVGTVPLPSTIHPSSLGAAAATAPAVPVSPAPQSFTQSLVRAMMRALSEPQSTSNLFLGFIGVLLVFTLGAGFFVHVQVQHPQMLMRGVLVATMALGFLFLNKHLSGTLPSAGDTQSSAVVIGADSASTGYALFPN